MQLVVVPRLPGFYLCNLVSRVSLSFLFFLSLVLSFSFSCFFSACTNGETKGETNERDTERERERERRESRDLVVGNVAKILEILSSGSGIRVHALQRTLWMPEFFFHRGNRRVLLRSFTSLNSLIRRTVARGAWIIFAGATSCFGRIFFFSIVLRRSYLAFLIIQVEC